MSYYDSIADGYPTLHHEEQLRKLALVRGYLEKDWGVLDVGCGAGVSSVLITDRGSVMGIDPSLGLLAHCTYPCVQGIAEHLPFKDKSFDAIICMTACHHFEDMDLALSEMKRVATKRIIISVLRKAKNFDSCAGAIQKHFCLERKIEDRHDVIFLCSL